ncbi:hypothetical protein KORDIASMS9_04539 [Kordia sp. SMS9]|uniref:DUF6705 family protein n=1 Tax=Kordia sp. SMS9 TaxID=2282170 RepID=UPI000E0DFE73|nr:DUF6705 family protein [Kordia sp. SMS9]AXG72270.1 hypothetical protein KORDIASMS9_04539 [Kordia sp. SMS9]
MKKYILILTLLGLTSCSTAQAIIPIENEKGFQEQDGITYYYKDVNGELAKFTGTWKYETATEIFEITFYLKIKKDNGSSYEDQLLSKFKYIQNGVEIYNTYQEIDPLNFFGGFFVQPNNTNKINLSYHEPNVVYKSRRKRLNLEYIPATGIGQSPTVLWKRDVWQGSPAPPPYQVPKIMTLVKQ